MPEHVNGDPPEKEPPIRITIANSRTVVVLDVIGLIAYTAAVTTSAIALRLTGNLWWLLPFAVFTFLFVFTAVGLPRNVADLAARQPLQGDANRPPTSFASGPFA